VRNLNLNTSHRAESGRCPWRRNRFYVRAMKGYFNCGRAISYYSSGSASGRTFVCPHQMVERPNGAPTAHVETKPIENSVLDEENPPHDLKVEGSNPPPAAKKTPSWDIAPAGFFHVWLDQRH